MPQANVPCRSSGVGGPAGPRPELPLGLVSRDPLPICPTGWHLNCLQFLKGLCNSVPSSVYLAFWLTAPPQPTQAIQSLKPGGLPPSLALEVSI